MPGGYSNRSNADISSAEDSSNTNRHSQGKASFNGHQLVLRFKSAKEVPATLKGFNHAKGPRCAEGVIVFNELVQFVYQILGIHGLLFISHEEISSDSHRYSFHQKPNHCQPIASRYQRIPAA